MIRNNVTFNLSQKVNLTKYWQAHTVQFMIVRVHLPCQIIYVTPQDTIDVIYVMAILIRASLVAPFVFQHLGQFQLLGLIHGNYDDLSWYLDLGVTFFGS